MVGEAPPEKRETMSHGKKTINGAVRSRNIRRALAGMVGCPVGGWAETVQAKRALIDELPLRSERNYTADELIDRALTVDFAGRYALRGDLRGAR